MENIMVNKIKVREIEEQTKHLRSSNDGLWIRIRHLLKSYSGTQVSRIRQSAQSYSGKCQAPQTLHQRVGRRETAVQTLNLYRHLTPK